MLFFLFVLVYATLHLIFILLQYGCTPISATLLRGFRNSSQPEMEQRIRNCLNVCHGY
jgi:hypothetical protein